MTVSLSFWFVFSLLILGMLWLDLKVFHKNAHEVKSKEALTWSLFWIGLSLCFAAGIFILEGYEKGFEFLAGYTIEKTLSIDNIFVFSIIFQKLAIPLKYQHRVLFWGILGALVLRALMIWAGSELISHFHFVIYILGSFLVFTGIKTLWTTQKELTLETHPFVLILQKYVSFSPALHGQKLLIFKGKKWIGTPLLLALAMIEFADVIFAIDSIPAIFAITLDPFIVYTSNIFAILGLRSLYFLLADAIDRFRYLKTGVALILCFVGLKMIIMDYYHVSIEWSLMVIVLILTGSILLSKFERCLKCLK